MYFYDNAGNITEYRTYTYTLSNDLSQLEPISSIENAYEDSEWGDLLTKYGDTEYTYDAVGNLTNDGTWTYTWQHGRQLASMNNGTYNNTYTYDTEGRRTSKTIRGVYRRFYYSGDKLIRETWGAQTVDYFYDANGEIYAMLNNGSMYYYVKNLQGDVVKMVDASGNVVASYSYYAYGKEVASSGSLAVLNPIRYRSYYYDEAGVYYLGSRYYSTKLGRFINADSYVSTAQGLLSANMFAYCNNNPIMYCDSEGKFPWLVVAILAIPTLTGILLGATADEKLGADIKKEDEFTTIEDIDESKPKLLLPYKLEGLSPENFEDATNKKTISPVTEETAELTTGDRIANAAIGGAIGLAVGGAVLATGGAAGAVAVGWKSVIDILGITSAQSFAIGSLAYDLVGMVLPIFFAVEMEPIEYSD